MGRTMRRVTPLVLVCAGIAAPGPARANGRPAATVSVALERTPGRRVLLGTTFGLLVSPDGGGNWRWICEPAVYVGGTTGEYDPRYLVSARGTLFAALSSGLSISRDGGCSWELAGPPLRGAWIKDIAQSPIDPQVLYVVTATTAVANGLFVTRDDGRTFSPVGAADPVAFYWRVVAAGGDAWASGYTEVGGGRARLWRYRGQDGTVMGIEHRGLEQALPQILLFGASQQRPGQLFLLGHAAGGDTLFRSDDGGESWSARFAAPAIPAALLDGRETLWLATPKGLQVSTDAAASLRVISRLSLGCLGERDGVLYACGSNALGMALGRSSDGGTSFVSVLRLQDIAGPALCPAGSATRDRCDPLWPTLAMQIGAQSSQADGGAGGGAAPARSRGIRSPSAKGSSADAGSPGGGASSGAAGCQVGHVLALGAVVVLLLALLGALLGRRQGV
jgi:hypothetical protein